MPHEPKGLIDDSESTREERLRKRWLELADSADSREELALYFSMLLEELAISRGLLLKPEPVASRDGETNRPSKSNTLKEPDRQATERLWLNRLHQVPDLTEAQEVFKQLLQEYLSHSDHKT